MTTTARLRALLLASAAALVVLSSTAGVVHFANADASRPTTTTTSSTSTSTTTTSTTTTSTTIALPTTAVPPTTAAPRQPVAKTTTTMRSAIRAPQYDPCDVKIQVLQSNPDHLFITVVDPKWPNTNIVVTPEWVTPTAMSWNPSYASSQSDANGKVVIDRFISDDWMAGHVLRIRAQPSANFANQCEPHDIAIDYSPSNYWAG